MNENEILIDSDLLLRVIEQFPECTETEAVAILGGLFLLAGDQLGYNKTELLGALDAYSDIIIEDIPIKELN